MRKKHVVVGVLGPGDSHFIAATFLTQVLIDAGFSVTNIGPACPLEAFIKAAIETNADAIAMSSHLGYAEEEVAGYQQMLAEAGLQHIASYIGGNLAVGSRSPEEIKQRFKELGFTRAYPGATDLDQFAKDLKEDLKIK